VLSVVAQLQGFEAAIASWEGDVLSARVAGYRSEWLDALSFSGEVLWGRLSRRSASSVAGRNVSVSRATPVTLGLRADWHWLEPCFRGPETQPHAPELPAVVASLLACLREHGALFAAELAQELSVSPAELNDALWDAVARGLITSDGFGALRGLLQRREGRSLELNARSRRSSGGALLREGRWALLRSPRVTLDRDGLADTLAEQLLARWGVVFADVLARENLALPYRDMVWALRRLEARGVARGGRFVSGFVGEQYALPDAVEQLRAVRKSPKTGETVRLSACDPLNLVGIIVPGERVPAQRGRQICLVDGALSQC
jgi:ATP-dependent Lhr-like helicase